MKRITLLLVFFFVGALSYAQINMQHKGSLKELFSILQNKYGYKFVYSNDEINDKLLVSIAVQNAGIETVLNEVSKQTKISYRIINKQIIIKPDKRKNEKPTGQKDGKPVTHTKTPNEKIASTSSKSSVNPKKNIVHESGKDIKNTLQYTKTKESSHTELIKDVSGKAKKNDTLSSIKQTAEKELTDTFSVTETKDASISTEQVISEKKNEYSMDSVKKEETQSEPETKKNTPVYETNQKKETGEISCQNSNTYEFGIQNNLLYDLVLIPNLGVECKINERLGIIINGLWTHIKWDNGNKTYRIWAVNPEVRYYFQENIYLGAIYLGAMFHIGQLNIKVSSTGYQGDFIGGGLTGGYVMYINDRFRLDLGIGLGYAYFKYDSYNFIDGINIKKDSGIKNFWGPIKAGVTLTFVL